MLSEYAFFIDFLISRYGQERLDAYVKAMLVSAEQPEAAFARQFGVILPQADQQFGIAIRQDNWLVLSRQHQTASR